MRECVKKFYKEVDSVSKQVPAVQQTVKHVPEIYKKVK